VREELWQEQYQEFLSKHLKRQGETMAQRKQQSTSSYVLSTEEKKELKKEIEKHKTAQKQLTDALGVLWNSQLDVAVTFGKADLIEKALGRPAGLWDDCDCNTKNCGGCGGGESRILPDEVMSQFLKR
jgi:hypothetical protein